MKATSASATDTVTTALPASVKRFLEAANRSDAIAAADSFTADASVRDENHDYLGRGAIRAWVAGTSGKYRPAFTVIRSLVRGDDASLAVAVSGQFPGSPVTLDFVFRLRNGKISSLTIE